MDEPAQTTSRPDKKKKKRYVVRLMEFQLDRLFRAFAREYND